MVNENARRQKDALVVYKNKPALVKEITGDKIVIVLAAGDSIKVREKDIEAIHPGPARNFSGIDDGAQVDGNLRETWELLLAEQGQPVSLRELAELAFGEYSPAAAWSAYCLLLDGLYFTGTIDAVRPRSQEQVEADEKKRGEKQRASGERELFLERLRKRQPLDDDRRFIQDIEALAFGKTGKSRTMKDIGLGETPEEAHALLLECGFWTEQVNPHPERFGVSLQPAAQNIEPLPEEVRHDLTHLAAFAIDSPWSHDPDDAVSLETVGGKCVLYVHIADPASSITADSLSEKEARDRGATLYIPEGNFRMLADKALPLFALGLTEVSPALTFKMTLNDSGEIEAVEVFPSTVKVLRLTYQEADMRTDMDDFFALARRNIRRRSMAGAITIDMPQVHISLNQEKITVEPIVPYRSADMVRECMLLAGEGAGIWAMQHNLPFPYIEQETAEIPADIFSGVAGSYQLRRCMRPRILSVKPGRHWGLGLDTYTQVTSPLRRYTDLLAHIQIRAFLRGETPLSAEEVMARMSAGEAAAMAVSQAERASRSHWLMVYLADKKNSVCDAEHPCDAERPWDAIALEKKGNRWAVIIPALALETQVPLRKDIAPNDPLKLILKSVNIPKGEALFMPDE